MNRIWTAAATAIALAITGPALAQETDLLDDETGVTADDGILETDGLTDDEAQLGDEAVEPGANGADVGLGEGETIYDQDFYRQDELIEEDTALGEDEGVVDDPGQLDLDEGFGDLGEENELGLDEDDGVIE